MNDPQRVPATGPRRERLLALLAAIATLVFFSNVPVYVGLFVLPAVQPLHWIVAFAGVTALLLLQPEARARGLPAGIALWCGAYAAMCLVWFAAFGGGDPQILRKRLLALAFLIVAVFLFGQGPRCVVAARRTLAVAVVLAVLLNAYDITHPYFFVPAYSEFAMLGRAAGLYANANSAGAALVLGFALSVGIVPQRLRALYILLVAGGVVLTLSRGAMLGFVLVTLALYRSGVIRGRSMLWATLAGALIGWLVWVVVIPVVATDFKIEPDLIVSRILWLLDPDANADFSQQERTVLAELGWQQYLAAPFLGNGVGSTELWAARTSTHNLYLMLMSDFGTLGAFVLPALALAAVSGHGEEGRRCRVAFAGFLLFWGLVNHNMLTDYFLLLAIALMAAMTRSPEAGAAAGQEPAGRERRSRDGPATPFPAARTR